MSIPAKFSVIAKFLALIVLFSITGAAIYSNPLRSSSTEFYDERMIEFSFDQINPEDQAKSPGYLQYYYCMDGSALWWRIPDAYIDNYLNQRFTSSGHDTLESFGIMMYEAQSLGTPSLHLYVWGDSSGFPDTTNVLFDTVIAYANIEWYPYWVTVNLAGYSVIVDGDFHIGWSTTNYPSTSEYLACLSDVGNCGELRSSNLAEGNSWMTMRDTWGSQYDVNFFIFAELARTYSGPEWHVSPFGNDANRGTEADPFETIQRGINKARWGHSVEVHPGNYFGGGNTNLSVDQKRVVIHSTNGPDFTSINPGPFTDAFAGFTGTDSTTIIQGFSIESCLVGVDIMNASVKVQNVEFIECEFGIRANKHIDSTLETPLVCRNSSFLTGLSHGIYSRVYDHALFVIDSCEFDDNYIGIEGEYIVSNSTIKNGVYGLGRSTGTHYGFTATNCLITGHSNAAVTIADTSQLINCGINDNLSNPIYGNHYGGSEAVYLFLEGCQIDNNQSNAYLAGDSNIYLYMKNTRYSNNASRMFYDGGWWGGIAVIDSCEFIDNVNRGLSLANVL